MPKKMTLTQLKKHLLALNQDEMVDLVCRLYKSSSDASNFICMEFDDSSYEAELFEETKKKIRNQFFPTRGMGRLSLSTAKKAISDFKKTSKNINSIIELQVYYVECCGEFTDTYGDINDSFYNSMESMFETVIKALNKANSDELYGKYYPRLKAVVTLVKDFGWGLYDNLSYMLKELNYSEN